MVSYSTLNYDARLTTHQICSYSCSYKMILRPKHAVHQPTTPFQTERYSWPRHLVASFPFHAQAKNRKMPSPNRPIRCRTLYTVLFSTQLVYVLIVFHHRSKQNRASPMRLIVCKLFFSGIKPMRPKTSTVFLMAILAQTVLNIRTSPHRHK